jgi:hypothetical protein
MWEHCEDTAPVHSRERWRGCKARHRVGRPPPYRRGCVGRVDTRRGSVSSASTHPTPYPEAVGRPPPYRRGGRASLQEGLPCLPAGGVAVPPCRRGCRASLQEGLPCLPAGGVAVEECDSECLGDAGPRQLHNGQVFVCASVCLGSASTAVSFLCEERRSVSAWQPPRQSRACALRVRGTTVCQRMAAPKAVSGMHASCERHDGLSAHGSPQGSLGHVRFVCEAWCVQLSLPRQCLCNRHNMQDMRMHCNGGSVQPSQQTGYTHTSGFNEFNQL